MVKKLEGAGLRGQVAGETSLSTVGQIEGLAYRGHKVETLADKASFEEVAYLLLYNKLPNKSELSEYKIISGLSKILNLDRSAVFHPTIHLISVSFSQTL